jgi:hypothetical protein
VGEEIVSRIKDAFKTHPDQVKCAVVEDFAIRAEPDLHASIKQALPLNVLKVVAYTNQAGKTTMEQAAGSLAQYIATIVPQNVDFVTAGDILYVRLNLEGAKSVFLKVEFIVDDNEENWVLPGHKRDLKAIVKQYRRAIPRHTEYYLLAQKKEILRKMETALTTY